MAMTEIIKGVLALDPLRVQGLEMTQHRDQVTITMQDGSVHTVISNHDRYNGAVVYASRIYDQLLEASQGEQP